MFPTGGRTGSSPFHRVEEGAFFSGLANLLLPVEISKMKTIAFFNCSYSKGSGKNHLLLSLLGSASIHYQRLLGLCIINAKDIIGIIRP